MAIFDPLNPNDGRKATDGHTEPAITLLDGRTLACYPKAGTAMSSLPDNGGKNFFTDHALFFFDHREQILSDSRMFLAPVPIASGLAYVGSCGFQHPTLGVYIEWWMRYAPFILGKQGKE